MKNFFKLTKAVLVFALVLLLCSCSVVKDGLSSVNDISVSGDNIEVQNSEMSNTSQNDDETALNNSSAKNQDTDGEYSQSNRYSQQSNVSSNVSSETKPQSANKSGMPNVNIFAQVASDIYVVGGFCSKATEYISIGGNSTKAFQIKPVSGKDNNYFISQVKINSAGLVEICAKESGKDLSEKISFTVSFDPNRKNSMTLNEYTPVFGLDNRAHSYSAVLAYTKSDFLSSVEKKRAEQKILETVNTAKSVNTEVIYLVVPSSAAVYPETLPNEYKEASGETLYKAFKNIAENSGATVIYPLSTFKAHKDDGNGYKIYSHTDSHWTTYGAYFGVCELMTHIQSRFLVATPRSLADMGFYTTELYGGDSLFSFGDGNGFENYSQAKATNGLTAITGINELTVLYSRKMPTDTLIQITRGKRSIYLTEDNANAQTVSNSNGADLPTAVVVRDSFGRTAYDMINDRFSQVCWLDENDYTTMNQTVLKERPDYLIYIVSERNLLKVMLNNQGVSLCNEK